MEEKKGRKERRENEKGREGERGGERQERRMEEGREEGMWAERGRKGIHCKDSLPSIWHYLSLLH